MARNELLIRQRELRGWAQSRVAEQIDAATKRVGEWERGEKTPSPLYQERLCQLFGCDASMLGFIAPAPAIEVSMGLWPNDLLASYHQGVLALHNLYLHGHPQQVEAILPLYCKQTAALVQPGPLAKTAANITSLALQLACELACDREDFGAAKQAGQGALHFAQLAEDRSLQVASLIGLANLGFHRKHSTAAKQAYLQAIALFDESVTPLLKGRTYAGLAEVHAMRGEEQEALRTMGLAFEIYPMFPEEDPAYPYLHASRYALHVFGGVQPRLFLGQPREAEESLQDLIKEGNMDVESEPATKLDWLYYQAESMTQRGELEASSSSLQEAVLLAKGLGSRLYLGKLVETYEVMRSLWPHEKPLLKLEEVFRT